MIFPVMCFLCLSVHENEQIFEEVEDLPVATGDINVRQRRRSDLMFGGD
jgi:hypothetical protein